MHPRSLQDWLQYIETLHHRSVDMGLERVRRVLHRIVAPPLPFRVINVAGTNGKGSAVAMFSTILQHAGYAVGAYTSPHLVHYRERISINGSPVSDDEVCDAFAAVEQVRDGIPLTYFEFGTAAALWLFVRHPVEVAVLEVGMGGRLDAVNALEPDAALVTSIAIDHEQWLGNTRELIGREKAGIYRAGRPAVCADPEPPESLIGCARGLGAELRLLGREFGYLARRDGWDWWDGDVRLENLPAPSLIGAVQLQNASGVLATLSALREVVPVSARDIARALPAVRIRGRFEVMSGASVIILDVAHNAAAARVLRANLMSVGIGVGRTLAVFAMLRDKAADQVAEVLSDQIDEWHIGTISGERGASAESIAAMVRAGFCGQSTNVHTYGDVVQAFVAASRRARAQDRVVVFGSFYTVGAILAHLEA